jgi:hypothetical protein
MYPLMTAAELAEILFFVRAQRTGSIRDFILTAIFLALAIAANFTAAFILVSEALWLIYLAVARSHGWPGASLRVAGPGLSLVAGIALLLPWRRAARSLLQEQIRNRDFGWIPYQPPIHWSYEVLHSSAGYQWLFWLLLALTILAIWRQWDRAPLLLIFMAAALVGPFAAVAVASLFGVQMMVDRYVLIAVVAFLELAAIGAACLESKLGQAVVLLLILCSTRAVKPLSVDWRRAVAIASGASSANARIGVVPVSALDVVRYHMPPRRRPFAVGLKSQCGDPRTLIVSPGSTPPVFMSVLRTCYPRLVGRVSFLEVRSR